MRPPETCGSGVCITFIIHVRKSRVNDMKEALDRPCPVCDARVAEWCIDGSDWANIHLDRAFA